MVLPIIGLGFGLWMLFSSMKRQSGAYELVRTPKLKPPPGHGMVTLEAPSDLGLRSEQDGTRYGSGVLPQGSYRVTWQGKPTGHHVEVTDDGDHTLALLGNEIIWR